MDDPPSKPTCRTCGKTIPSFAPGGHCPHCLLRSVPAENDAPDSSWESRFTVLSELGEGGFGKVFLAEQHEPVRRQVAFKVIKPGMDSREVIARFEVERQTLASLDHTNIARIYDAGELSDGRPAIAMEFVPGVAITRFANDEELGLNERLDLFLQVCRGVEHAHLHGIIHRDLKPGNLLAFRGVEDSPVVRIIDFGIAKATQQRASDVTLVTLQALALGTPAYMSPEQAEGRFDIDARTDVYSLGAILYELLSGVPPLETTDEVSWGEMLSQIQNSAARRPSERITNTPADLTWNAKELKGDLDWIALTAISKDRDRRYQSVSELRRDIEAHLEGRAVDARPPSKRYRLKKLILRHRVASAAMATAAMTLIAGTIVSTMMAIRAAQAQQTAELAGAEAVDEREKSREMFSKSDYQQGCQMLDNDQFEEGIAHLCRALRTNPENFLAADRLLNTLAYTNFLAPLTKEASHPSRNINVYFRNEREFITVCEESVIGIWDRRSGERIGDWLNQNGIDNSESALSTDRNHLATGSYKGFVHVWNLENRKLLFKSGDHGEDGIVRAVDFIDDHRVAAGFTGGWVRVWDFREGKLLWQKEVGHLLEWLDASPDGKWLAISGDLKAYLLNSNDGERHFEFPHSRPIRRARFSPKGDRILTASIDNSARIWSVSEGRPLTPPMSHELSLYDANWAPGGVRVATVGYDDSARLWAADTGHPLTTSLRHDDDVYQAIIPLGGSRLITGSRDQRLRYWNAATSQLAAASSTQPRSVSAMALDDNQVLIGGRHEQVRLLDLRPRAARPVKFSFPGTLCFAQIQSSDEVLKAFYQNDQGTFREERQVPGGELKGKQQDLGLSEAIYLAKNGDSYVIRHNKRRASLYKGTEKIVPPFDFPTNLTHVEIDNEGKFVFLCGADGKATVLALDQPSDGEFGLEAIPLEPFPGEPADDVIMKGQPLKIAVKKEDEIRVFDLHNRQWLPGTIHHPGGIGEWDFSPDHELLITGGYDDTARLWNPATGEMLGEPLEHADANSYKTVKVKLSPDGRFAVTSSWHELGTRVWSTKDGSLVTNLLYQNGHIVEMAIDPTSRYLATIDDIPTFRIWSLEDGQPALPVQRLLQPIRNGRFSADGKNFLAIENQSVLIWPLPACNHAPDDWVVTMSEQIVGRSLDDEGVLHWLSDTPHSELRPGIPNESSKPYANWLDWITSDPRERSPDLAK
jgi:serine/threonine protein kinase/WD40 repeat protein